MLDGREARDVAARVRHVRNKTTRDRVGDIHEGDVYSVGGLLQDRGRLLTVYHDNIGGLGHKLGRIGADAALITTIARTKFDMDVAPVRPAQCHHLLVEAADGGLYDR